MKEKGFTLIELVAVIVILGVLVIMITPAIIGMRNNVINNTLENKISMIQEAALDYASDSLLDVPKGFNEEEELYSQKCYDEKADFTSPQEKLELYKTNDSSCTQYCLLVLVKTLIDKGYIVGDTDGRTSIENPLTGESLNSQVVCVRYTTEDPENRELIAYILGEECVRGNTEYCPRRGNE